MVAALDLFYTFFSDLGVSLGYSWGVSLGNPASGARWGHAIYWLVSLATPVEPGAMLSEHRVVCRLGDLMPEDLIVEAQ
jgi:hypothetical protein